MKNVLLVLALMMLPTLAGAEPDYAREQRWADEIVPAVVVGHPAYLEASGRTFLALYTPRPNATAAAVIVHGMGVHPDWGLISPLRTGLADQGYATLSIQMPVLAADAEAERYTPLFPDGAARMKAAVAFLHARGIGKVALVAHSMGARMANFFLRSTPDAGVDAWVAIGMPGEYVGAGALKQPVLDIYGEGDFPAIIANTEKRAAAIRRIRGSAQVQVAGADHFFNGREDELVKHIKLFLDRALR